ncbi:hypothetical protein PVAND_005692 [Polypedilum vanderplanki]|uniref:Small ribosomal subunit protein bS16m n=1 Tax=Polypedilum vanderplanki TaxID=319348 RepID=A0A9J6C1T2_POLVA|nr:hypothetical protein PVAND_005692 [Polypedilum vanderplanki]
MASKAFENVKMLPRIRNALSPASGTGQFYERSAKSIRLFKQGCTNRPFFQIVVMERRKPHYEPVIEQVGTYDPMPNKYNQIMVSFNYERIRHWIGHGAHISTPVLELLGLSGFYPIYPKTYMKAWRARATEAKKETVQESS